jgi:hypothetical protein
MRRWTRFLGRLAVGAIRRVVKLAPMVPVRALPGGARASASTRERAAELSLHQR